MKRTALKRGKPLQRRAPLRRGAPLKRGKPLQRKTGIKRRASIGRAVVRESAAEKRARLCFAAEVCREDLGCFFAAVDPSGAPRRPGHVCDGALDPHHLIAKSWIQRYFGDLPEDELLAIKYAVILGCPLDRAAHDALPANLHHGARVFYEELEEDLIDFVLWVDRRHGGTGRPSMAARLELECPRREADRLRREPLAGVGDDSAFPPDPRWQPPVVGSTDIADSGESDVGGQVAAFPSRGPAPPATTAVASPDLSTERSSQ